MKKWFIKQEWPKTDEERIVVGNDATTDEERHEQSEASSLDSRTTQPPPPRLKQELDKEGRFVYCGQDEPEENAPSETDEEYGRRHSGDRDEHASRRKQFMRLFVPDAKPSITPQVCWLYCV